MGKKKLKKMLQKKRKKKRNKKKRIKRKPKKNKRKKKKRNQDKLVMLMIALSEKNVDTMVLKKMNVLIKINAVGIQKKVIYGVTNQRNLIKKRKRKKMRKRLKQILKQ